MSFKDKLAEKTFDPLKFVGQHWKARDDDVRKLRELRGQVQALAEESAHIAKKNVSHNYSKFIATAKEISHLESEMYQLSHLLGEQKKLIDLMMEVSPTGSKDKSNNAHDGVGVETSASYTQRVQHLLEKIDNCSSLPENPKRELLLESDLTELNFETGATIKHVHALLVSDGLMIVTLLKQSIDEPFRYTFEAFFQLENLALISVCDGSTASFNSNRTFKLLVFPEHKLYMCANSRLKKKWIDGVESAKRHMIREGSLMRQATIRMRKWEAATKHTAPFETAAANTTPSGFDASEMDYLRELPDELEACIVQRDFDNVVDLLQEGRDCVSVCTDTALAREIGDKLQQKHQQLVDLLCKELKVPTYTGCEKNLHGGPKAARKAMTLLIRLGRSSQACDLYLKNRSAFLRHSIGELQLTDNSVNYARELTKLICQTLASVAREFLLFFAHLPSCFSVYTLWASGEVKGYVGLLTQLVLDSAPPLLQVGQCLRLVYDSFSQLADLGLDLSFELDSLLGAPVVQALSEHMNNFIGALQLRIGQDEWKPHSLRSEAKLTSFLGDMVALGLQPEDDWLCGGDCSVWLTAQSCQLARAVLPLAAELVVLRDIRPFAAHTADHFLLAVWRLQLAHVGQAVQAGRYALLVDRNARFIVGCLLPLCERAYMNRISLATQLRNEYPALSVYFDSALERVVDV